VLDERREIRSNEGDRRRGLRKSRDAVERPFAEALRGRRSPGGAQIREPSDAPAIPIEQTILQKRGLAILSGGRSVLETLYTDADGEAARDERLVNVGSKLTRSAAAKSATGPPTK